METIKKTLGALLAVIILIGCIFFVLSLLILEIILGITSFIKQVIRILLYY